MFLWESAPRCWVRDNDRAYGHVVVSRVRAVGIYGRPISPRSPWQHGIAERLMGTLHRECLDQLLVSGEAHLRGVLAGCAAYCNRTHPHLPLQKDTPLRSPIQQLGTVVVFPSPADYIIDISGYDLREGQVG